MQKRTLGKSAVKVSPIGMGGWAIGGPWTFGDWPVGWGNVEDEESLRALECAFDLGINFFETADVYGGGHSEALFGQAFHGKRDQVVLASKFGMIFDEKTKEMYAIPAELSPTYVRRACEASLRRMKTDYIDFYMLHVTEYMAKSIPDLIDTLESLVEEGKIRFYGWCNEETENVRIMAKGKHCALAQRSLNVMKDHPAAIAMSDELNLGLLANSPLGMGILTGKFKEDSKLPEDDVRSWWDFSQGEQAEQLKKLTALREILTSQNRTLAQGALAWLLARSERILPIPGFKTVKQVKENAGALEKGPLSKDQMLEIERILGRSDS